MQNKENKSKETTAIFGPAGNSEDFFDAGHKSALEAPLWVKEHNLECYEYQCGHGVKISEDAAKILGKNAAEAGVLLSIHAPYYISLSSTEEEKRDRSIEYILQTLRAAKYMGAERIVVHSGSCGSITRKEALALASDTLYRALNAAAQEGLDNIYICPETMGKVKQLGTVDEVVKLCRMSDMLIPTLDFGHINAQTLGGLKTKSDYEAVLETLDKKLNSLQARSFHSHFSRIEYTKAGEKKHHTLAETQYEPEFEPLAEIIAQNNLSPRIICESAGTQTTDAAELKRIYTEKRLIK